MLTLQQSKTLDFIKGFITHNNYSPSLNEIAIGIGISSRGVAHRYVNALIVKGFLYKHPNSQRGLELVEQEDDQVQSFSIPFLGKIAAGLPLEAIADDSELDLGQFFAGPDKFALRVSGESMIEIGINDDDYVIIKKQQTASDGDIVVAMIDRSEVTLKRFRRRPNNQIALIPENREMEPMIYDEERVTVQGILIGQMRAY